MPTSKLSLAAQTLGHAGGKVGGLSTSPAKRAASRENGKRGGWPKGRPRKGYVKPPPANLTSSLSPEDAARQLGKVGGKIGGKVLSDAKLAHLRAAAKKPRPSRRKTVANPAGE